LYLLSVTSGAITTPKPPHSINTQDLASSCATKTTAQQISAYKHSFTYENQSGTGIGQLA